MEENELSLMHQATHTWRPVDVSMERRAELKERLDDGLSVYWEIFLASGSPACVVLTAIDLLQRVLLADQGAAPLTPCLPAACLWIASKVVEGQNSPLTSGPDLLHTWNDVCMQLSLPRMITVLSQLVEAEVHVLTQLQFQVTYATTYDLVAALLRLAPVAREARLRATIRLVETLMLLEGKPQMLQYTPSQVAASLCPYLNLTPPAYFDIPPPSLIQEVEAAWQECFDT